MAQNSGPQTFWNWGLVLWRKIFPWTGGGGETGGRAQGVMGAASMNREEEGWGPLA